MYMYLYSHKLGTNAASSGVGDELLSDLGWTLPSEFTKYGILTRTHIVDLFILGYITCALVWMHMVDSNIYIDHIYIHIMAYISIYTTYIYIQYIYIHNIYIYIYIYNGTYIYIYERIWFAV